MRKILLCLLVIFCCRGLNSCMIEESEGTKVSGNLIHGTVSLKDTTTLNHHNIVLALDLSNRLVSPNRPLSDDQIVEAYLNSFFETIIRCDNRKQNQKDRIMLKIINQGLASQYGVNLERLNIDLAEFQSDQFARIEYIKNRSKRKKDNDLKAFTQEVSKAIEVAKQKSNGCDVWKFLNEDCTAVELRKEDKLSKIYGKTVLQSYQNTIVIFTDGYMEAGNYGSNNCLGNKCYYLSHNVVNNFREQFKKSGTTDLEGFFYDNEYGIVPLENELIAGSKVLVIECDDRSLTSAGNTTVRPTDREILELFWTDWINQAGAEIQFEPFFETLTEAREVFESFIGCK
jgi:hypothetical protein